MIRFGRCSKIKGFKDFWNKKNDFLTSIPSKILGNKRVYRILYRILLNEIMKYRNAENIDFTRFLKMRIFEK